MRFREILIREDDVQKGYRLSIGDEDGAISERE